MQWLPLKVLQFFKNSRNGVARLYEQKQHECELVTTSYWPKRRVHVIQLRLNLSPCMPQYRAILSALHVLWVKLLIKILIRLSQDVPGCPRHIGRFALWASLDVARGVFGLDTIWHQNQHVSDQMVWKDVERLCAFIEVLPLSLWLWFEWLRLRRRP